MEFALLKDSDPGLERPTPAPGDCGRHIEGFAQEGITDFGKVGLAIAGTPGTTFCRTQPGIGSQLPRRSEFLYQLTRPATGGSESGNAGNGAKQLALAT